MNNVKKEEEGETDNDDEMIIKPDTVKVHRLRREKPTMILRNHLPLLVVVVQ